MPTYLTDEFVRSAQREPVTIQHGDRTVILQNNTWRYGIYSAELAVVENGDIVGYITPYGTNEHGAVRARLAGMVLPAAFRTLDDALDEILS